MILLPKKYSYVTILELKKTHFILNYNILENIISVVLVLKLKQFIEDFYLYILNYLSLFFNKALTKRNYLIILLTTSASINLTSHMKQKIKK